MKISASVEAEILASVCQETGLLDNSVLKHVKPEFFQVESYKWLAQRLIKRSWEPITYGYLQQVILDVDDEEVRGQYWTQLDSLYRMTLTFGKDAVQEFKKYVAYCSINSTLVAATDGYRNSDRIDYMLRDIRAGTDTAETVLRGDELKAVDYVTDFENRIDNRKQERDNPTWHPRILTGIPGLDMQFDIKGPVLINFLAPYKKYKSILLNSLGFSSLLQGFNVFHVSYENTYALTAARYDAAFSLLDMERMSKLLLTQEELDAFRSTMKWMGGWDNRLKIVKATPYETTTVDLSQELERLRETEGFNPDVIIMDYMNIVKPSASFKEERLQQNRIAWDMKNLADIWGTPFITASQANTEGSVADRLKKDHQGKSIGIAQAVDLTVTINQTAEEQAAGIVVLCPLISRAWPITQSEIVLDSDLNRMLISKSLPDLWATAAAMHEYKPD